MPGPGLSSGATSLPAITCSDQWTSREGSRSLPAWSQGPAQPRVQGGADNQTRQGKPEPSKPEGISGTREHVREGPESRADWGPTPHPHLRRCPGGAASLRSQPRGRVRPGWSAPVSGAMWRRHLPGEALGPQNPRARQGGQQGRQLCSGSGHHPQGWAVEVPRLGPGRMGFTCLVRAPRWQLVFAAKSI